MGNVEKKAKKTAQRARMQEILLATLYTAGAVTLMVMAPNALRLLKYAHPYLETKTDPSRRMQKTLSRMLAAGYVRRKTGGAYELTAKGTAHAERAYMVHQSQQKPARWDGRWRIVMFDIWEKRRSVRDRLRIMLVRIGFEQLQHSVWVYPYDCEEVIALIRTELNAGSGIEYFVADGLEGNDRLKKRFGLN